jgi:hypothetical protein
MQNNLIDYWSYSSLTLFLRNRLAFKKTYILKQYDNESSPASVVGKACHKAMEQYFKLGTGDVHDAIEAGHRYINSVSDIEINYGKTGSREQIIKTYTYAVDAYFTELPNFGKVLGVEESITTPVKDRNGNELPMPLKSISDIIGEDANGDLWVHDHKFVKYYSDGSEDKAVLIIQGLFNAHTIEAKYGKMPKGIVFHECKTSANKNGDAQVQPYVLEFSDPAHFAVFYQLINDCTKEIRKPDVMFLPNPQDMFDGQMSFEIYRNGLIGVDAPVAVQHKTKDVAFVEKAFVASKIDLPENANLTPEEKIRAKMLEFGITVDMQKTSVGAAITQYTFKVGRGRKLSDVERYAKDLQYALETSSIRVEAPIPGTGLVGIEVPSEVRTKIDFTDKHLMPGTLNIPVGVNVHGKVIHKDLSEMPHLLVAGSTGAGKSVMLNVIIKSLTSQCSPDELGLVLIDPKRVELSHFAGLPHILSEVIYDTDKATAALEWMVGEMDSRYEILQKAGARFIDDYNANQATKMQKIVIVIDEFADLMLSGGKTVEKAQYAEITERDHAGKPIKKFKEKTQDEKPSAEQMLVKLAQKARAVGIHLVLATQRPSADVVTGLLKANIPTKIAFMTTNKVNSIVILDQAGAEELTGKGDMLFLDPSQKGLLRLQGLYA